MDARAWIDLVLDPGWDLLYEDVLGSDPLGFPGYAEALTRARAATGCSESVLIARGTIGGSSALVVSFEFGFLGGSMGVAAGERICRAFELAARSDAAVVALTASGGARMQEGMLALAQMPATLHTRAGLRRPFIAYLRTPTTGGVFASFASSADLIWAEPGATIGFAGSRVAEAFTGAPLPEGSHAAEAARDAGLIDDVVEPRALRRALVDALARARIEIRLEGTPTPATYRTARRRIASAARLGLPIVTYIDTPGADPGAQSERDGIAREISMTFEALLAAPVPTVACVTGAGGSGGALALSVCDRLLIVEDAWFSVIAPEGAAAILRRDDVEQVARDLKISARDLRAFGLADEVVARDDVEAAIARALGELTGPTPRRHARWRVHR